MHLRCRDLGNRIDNLSNWEASILAALVNVQKGALKGNNLACGLKGKPGNGAPGVLLAQRLQDDVGQNVAVGDVVLLSGVTAGEVKACALEDHTLYLFVSPFDFVEKISNHSDTWRMTAEYAIWRAKHVDLALAWYMKGEDVVVLKR